MDSTLSHSLPGYSQPEHHLDHILQFHPHLQLVDDDSSHFASIPSSSSSSVSLSMFPMPGGGGRFNDLHYPLPPPLPYSLSRRGSDCSVLSNASSDGDGMLMMVENRGRLTRDQIQMLERQFSESPKPSSKIRRALAETTGLSVQRVGNWFQNRRAKAKQQKRQEEMQTRQILALAGRRRVTEPSSPVSSSPLLQAASMAAGSTTIMPKPRRAKSFADISSTPVRFLENHDETSPSYPSSSEASYASLARTLAVAAAAAAHADAVGGFQENSHEIPDQPQAPLLGYTCPYALGGTESPWPISRFSDYGSSTASSIIYTPTPAGQLEDPFEYDQIPPDCVDYHHYDNNSSQANSSVSEDYFDYHYPEEDDYSAFAAAIDAALVQRTFVLPAVPPTRFLRSTRAEPMQEQAVVDREIVRRDSCPNEFVDAFGSIELPQPEDPKPEPQHRQPSLAARRRRTPGPAPLGTASLRNSFMNPLPKPHSAGAPQPAHHISLPSTPMRRIKSTGAHNLPPPSSSPLVTSLYTRLLESSFPTAHDDDCNATIRPRTAGSIGATTTSLSQLFSQSTVVAPLTPVSPADSQTPLNDNITTTTGPAETSKVGVESQISPPPTPGFAEESGTPRNANFPLSSSSPSWRRERGDSEDDMPREFDEEGVLGLFALDAGIDINAGKEEAFPFERYLTAAVGGEDLF